MPASRPRTGRMGALVLLAVLLAGAAALGHDDSAYHFPEAGDDAAAPSAVDAHEHNDSLAQQVAAMRRQLHDLEDRRSLQDIIGAVGYIFGLAGVAFYVLGRRRTRGGEAAADNCPADSDGGRP